MTVAAKGISDDNFVVAYNRQLEDCTNLNFSAVKDKSLTVMIYNQEAERDVLGTGLAGPRADSQLHKTKSFVTYWFTWAVFFAGVQIHE